MFSHQGWLCIVLLDQLARQCISSLETRLRIVYLTTWSFVQVVELNNYELNNYLTAMFMYSFHHDKVPAFFDNFFSN